MRRSVALLSVSVSTLVGAAGAVAAPAQLSGRVVDGSLPAGGRGVTLVRAVDPITARVLAAVRAKRDGSYKLSVGAGLVTLMTDVVRSKGAGLTALTPVVRVRSGRRVAMQVSLKRRKPSLPSRKRRPKHALDAAAAAGPVIAVKQFTGSGPYSDLGPGLAAMLEGDLASQAQNRCAGQVVEWEHRDLLQQEINLQNSHPELFDPGTTVSPHWISPTVFVQGSVSTDSGGGMSWSLQLVSTRGQVIGSDQGSAPAGGDFTADEQIAGRLLDQLCPHHYQVTLQMTATVTVSSWTGSATIAADVTTAPDQSGEYTGKADLSWSSVQYGGIPKCTVVGSTNTGSFEPGVAVSGDGSLQVSWTGTADSTPTLSCPGGSFPGGLGVLPFINAAPVKFTLPAEGGQQAVSGGLQTDVGGWDSHGTITVKLVPDAATQHVRKASHA